MAIDYLFKNLTNEYAPVYTWFWNTKITKEGIRKQIDGMYENGIEGFYVLAEPQNFRPGKRNTSLAPDYMSEEYLDLLLYAHTYAKEKGMHAWLYNEGGFPSGMVCGEICRKNPELAQKSITAVTRVLEKGQAYIPSKGMVAAFCGDVRIKGEYTAQDDEEIIEYVAKPSRELMGYALPIFTDIANKKTTEKFLELTHERIKSKLGKLLGSELVYMFDDESAMESWTDGLEKLFFEKYGYEIEDYLPYITSRKTPETLDQKFAIIHYHQLCGSLVAENYFLTMKKWLNEHNMKSVGHLDLDHSSTGFVNKRYGNLMKMLRCFDVPGIDVIWEQIGYPKNDKSCPDGIEFFPRYASSAARQIGSPDALSESFAVYGSHLTFEAMRYILNFQAVRGINRFNFMTISYEQNGILPFQYRPNFIPQFLGTNMVRPLNEYTKRLSYLMQNDKAHIHTALYHPATTMVSGGSEAKRATEEFERLGSLLEESGVSFDIIDEDFVLNAKRIGDTLSNEYVSYDNIFVPEAAFEPTEVLEKLSGIKAEIVPLVKCDEKNIMARRIDSDDEHLYFVYNENNEYKRFKITFAECKKPYALNLMDGKIYECDYVVSGNEVTVTSALERGESIVYIFTSKTLDSIPLKTPYLLGELSDFECAVTRKFKIDDSGANNFYPAPQYKKSRLGLWDQSFSGEVTYKTTVNFDVPQGKLLLDLGKVNSYAKVFVDGKECATVTMPPYKMQLENVHRGSIITIVVSNTIANECAKTDYFSKLPLEWVGPYNEKMVSFEKTAPSGGLIGPVKLFGYQN